MVTKTGLKYTVERVDNVTLIGRNGNAVEGRRITFTSELLPGEYVVTVEGKSVNEAKQAILAEINTLIEIYNSGGE